MSGFPIQDFPPHVVVDGRRSLDPATIKLLREPLVLLGWLASAHHVLIFAAATGCAARALAQLRVTCWGRAIAREP